MQIKNFVVRRIEVDMVNDIALHGTRNLAVKPRPSSPATVAESMILYGGRVRFIGFYNRWVNFRNSFREVGNGAECPILPAPDRFSVRQSAILFLVSVKGVSVSLPHLVMAVAHFTSRSRAFAILALAANYLAAPLIPRVAVFHESLVVHEAKSVPCVTSGAFIYRADSIGFMGRHSISNYSTVKALGNSMAVPCMKWLAERIQIVDSI